jgi:hypothetical protein
VLPLVHNCNAASATVVSDNLKFGLFPDGVTDTARYSDFAAVKAAFEDVYACLGITCAQVGGLIQAIDANVAEAAACTHQSAVIAGYVPGSDVTQHNKILAAMNCVFFGEHFWRKGSGLTFPHRDVDIEWRHKRRWRQRAGPWGEFSFLVNSLARPWNRIARR